MLGATTCPQESTYLGATQAVMINYRVDDVDSLIEKLSAAAAWIDPKRDDSDFGKFAWIQDCDGNRIEL